MSYMPTMPNQRSVNVKITRRELCDLILACDMIVHYRKMHGGTGEKWKSIHDKLAKQRDAFDAKLAEEERV